jgi:hypothetical protein
MSGLFDVGATSNLQSRALVAMRRALYAYERPRVADFTSGWLNQGTATAVDTDCGVYMSDAHATGDRARSLLMPMPTPPFTVEAIFTANISPDFSQFGIQIRDSASGRGTTLCYSMNAGHFLNSQRWSAANTYVSANHFFTAQNIGNWPRPSGLRLVDDGTNITCFMSRDEGDSWVQYGSTTSRTAYLASPDRVGLYLNTILSAGSHAIPRGALIHSFRTF